MVTTGTTTTRTTAPRAELLHPGDSVAIAAHLRDLFAGGHNVHVGRSRVVHRTLWGPWVDGLTLPVPACRQAFGGLGVGGELLPTTLPVTCRRPCCADGDCGPELLLF
jgi:hypothetical protein